MDSIEVLLVEDNIYDAELTIDALKSNKLVNNIKHLSDGAEALDFIFCTGKYEGRVDKGETKLILLDIKMPKVNGIEVLQQIKANDKTKNIPVVMLTSSTLDPDIENCYKYGVNSYIVKPVGFDSFVKAVSKLGMYWLLLNQLPQK